MPSSPDEPHGTVAAGPWELCPYCAGILLLSAFVPAEDELATVVTVCPTCGRHVVAQPPDDPTG